MSAKASVKQLLLSKKITRNILFFLFHKKLSRHVCDRQIDSYVKKQTVDANKIVKDLWVCLTSFPARIDEVQYPVFSMLRQAILPEKIILWLSEEQFPNKEGQLPQRLVSLRNSIFEIHWCEDLRSYKKLVPALSLNEHKNIVICDDDIFYRKNTLKILWKEHLEHPNDVICHIGKKMVFEEGAVLPYEKWQFVDTCTGQKDVLPIGGGTILYPAEILENSPLLQNKELFKKLAFFADDIWFWWSITQAGYSVLVPNHSIKKMIYVNPEREYGLNEGLTLAKLNEGQNMNDLQLRNIVEYFQTDIFTLTNKTSAKFK